MPFIRTYIFKAELSKPALLDFISKTPPEYYCFVVEGTSLYGMLLTDDVIEYFINEFSVKSLEMVDPEIIRKVLITPGCKVWGNRELIGS